MSLTRSILRGLGSVFKSHRRDAVRTLMPGLFGGSMPLSNTIARIEYINHFVGWNYVAIKAIAEEIACLAPSVCDKEDGREVRDTYRKSLKSCRSQFQREELAAAFRARYVSHTGKRKALANLQHSDELKPVSNEDSLVRLLKNPNGPDVSWTFWYKAIMYLELTGATYIWAPPGKTDDKPKQLWVLPSHWVYEYPSRDPDDGRLVGEYEIRPTLTNGPLDQIGYGAGWYPGGGGKNERISADHIIKIAMPSPYSIIDGYAPVAAISSWIDVTNNIDRSRVQTFANKAFPGVAVEIDLALANPSPEEIERVQMAFAEKYVGVRNTGRPVILGPGMKIVPLSMSSVEMDYVNSSDQMRGCLMSAHRVPQSIAGLVELSTYANANAARNNFYMSCIKPKLMLIGQVMTEKLAVKWGENRVIYWDMPGEDDPESRLKKFETMTRGMAATPNEWREAEGFAPWEYGGSDPMGGMGQQPLGWATGEQPDPMAGMPGQEQPQDAGGGDPLDDVMGEMGITLGGDGAAEQPSGWDAAEKSINRIQVSTNGNGKH